MARFFRRGTSKIYWCPSVAAASTTGPTTPELNAGLDLSSDIQGMAGFQLTNTPIATPDLGSRFVKSIPGEDTTPASNLDFYDDSATGSLPQQIRTAIPKGQIGYIVLMPYGRITAQRCEVWSVQCTGVNDQWSTGNEAARFQDGFAILDVPNQNAVIP